MWAGLMNPGKKGRKGTAKHKGRKGRKKPNCVYDFVRTHPWSTLGEAEGACAAKRAIKSHKLRRAAHFRAVPRKFVKRSDIPNIVGSAMRGAVCGSDEALARAKARYCKKPAAIDRRGGGGGAKAEWAAGISEYLPWAANPGSPVGAITAGFRPKTIMGVLPMVGGVMATKMLTNAVYTRLPAAVKRGAVKWLVGIGSAGICGAAAGMVMRGIGQPVFLGGMVSVLMDVTSEIMSKGVVAALSGGDEFGEGLPGWQGIGGDEFNEGLPGWQGMGVFLTPGQTQDAQTMPSNVSQYPLPNPAQLEKDKYEEQVVSDAIAGVDALV